MFRWRIRRAPLKDGAFHIFYSGQFYSKVLITWLI